MVIHLLRYDDFSASSSQAVEEKLVALFLKHRLPCTFGVIPFVCSPENLLNAGEVRLSPLPPMKADLLKPLLDAGLAEIALHGFAHLSLGAVRGHQEFSQRMTPETQRQLIQRGRSHLETVFGVTVRLFVPPWNRLSPATAAVLQAEDLLLSSGGPEVAEPGQVNLAQRPCPAGIGETRRALATAGRWGRGNCVGTVIHDYDFKESGLGVSEFNLAEFEAQVEAWKNSGPIEPGLISDAISADRAAESNKALANFNLSRMISKGRLRDKLFPGVRQVYWEAATAERLTRLLQFIP